MKRRREDYPQVNYIDNKGIQYIELNRGCLRQCPFCYSDPNYKTFRIPQIRSNLVQIIGENILYDYEIKKKIKELGRINFNNKKVYYGLSQGIDRRILTPEIIQLLVENKIGLITKKGRWYKGMRISWDGHLSQMGQVKRTIEALEKAGYKRNYISVFMLVNWKISFKECMQKFRIIKKWKVSIDDCTWNTTKKEMKPHFWTRLELKKFRDKCRVHNIRMRFRGYYKIK